MVYKFPQLSWQEIAAMFGLSELKQTRVYQQGLEQGRENEARSLVVRLLTRRFDRLPDEVQPQLNQLPLEALEQLSEALLDFSGLEDLREWLQTHDQGDRK